MLIDVNGKPLTRQRPITREIAAYGIYDKYSTYPSDGLTPQRLAKIFKEADQGDVYRQMELFEEMEGKDLHLFSQFQTRKNAVTGLGYEILPYSSDIKSDTLDEITDFIYKVFENLDIEDIFMDLLDAIGKGFAVSEIIWKIKDGKVIPAEVKNRHQKKFFWDENNIFKVMTEENPQGEELPINKFIIHRYKARSGHASKAGILRVASWMYLFKNYAVKDWVAFAEVYGMPFRLGKYNAGASEADKEALQQALIMMGSDAAGIIPEGAEIEFKEAAKISSLNVYESLANFCNKEMSKAILGQTLTTDIGSNGSRAAAEVHDGVRKDLVEADCKALSTTLRNDLIKPLILFNYGAAYLDYAPSIKFNFEEPEDVEKNANTYRTIIKDIGLPVAEDHLYEKFGIPKPEEGQKVIKPSPSFAGLPLKNDLIVNKNKGIEYQNKIDSLADEATSISLELFKEVFKPIQELTNEVDSLEKLSAMLSDEDTLQKLLLKMKSSDLEDLIAKTMFLADLYGRNIEND